MRKKTVVFIFALFLFQSLGAAWAAQRGTEEYKKLAEYKKAQHEKKASGTMEKNFWQKEAERSGLAGTVAAVGTLTTSVIPLEKPNSGKKS